MDTLKQTTDSVEKRKLTDLGIIHSKPVTDAIDTNFTLVSPTDYEHFPDDGVREPPPPVSKAVQCVEITGKFILRCYRRTIRFIWIPPDEPMTRVMVKFREKGSSNYSPMSQHGWGSTDVRYRDMTIRMLKPSTIYEFALNAMLPNKSLVQYPKPSSSASKCACKTHPDVPDAPLELQYHYLRGNEYSLEWKPNNDNGEPIKTYELRTIPINKNLQNQTNWSSIIPYNLTSNQANFTLDTDHHSALQLRAVNNVGSSKPAYLVIRPPPQKVPARSYTSLFPPFNHMAGALTYSLLSIGLMLLFLLLLIFLIYRRRQKDVKSSKHSFLISFNPARRLNSSSGNGSSILGLGSDLTTSGLPLDLATLEPLWNQEVNSLYGSGKPDLTNFEQVTQIPAANIRFIRYVGCGAFGKVWEGWLHVHDLDGDRFEKVALKVRNCKSLTEAEFKREATLMHKYQHTNIVRFFGVSFDSPGQQCLVLEMMDQGNLRDYLHRSRPRIAPNVAANVFAAAAICAAANSQAGQGEAISLSEGSSMNTSTTSTAAGGGTPSASNVITLTAQLDLPALVTIMRDISHGCAYLEEQHFVHRDIAARNCLVSHNHPSGRIVKLCDFGLARDIYKNDYYRKRNEPKLPVRWMSPEAIRDGLFTTKSDVWAYAVTCWEVLTLGADPFYGRANMDVMNLVIGGHVLGRPENCPEELYNQLLQCWSRFTEMRPTFGQLAKKMDEFVLASQNSHSLFSAPFVVSLPLPKSLPGSTCQPVFGYHSNRNQHRESNDLSLSMLSNSGLQRASLDECQPSDLDTSNQEANTSLVMNSSKQPLIFNSHPKEMKSNTIKTKSHPNGYVVTPGAESLGLNKYNMEDTHNPNQITTSIAYESIISDPVTEQTTLATTSNSTSNSATHWSTINTNLKNSNSIKINHTNMGSASNDSLSRPSSIFDTVIRMPAKLMSETQTNSQKLSIQQRNDFFTPTNFDLSTKSDSSNRQILQKQISSEAGPSSGSTNNRSLTAYWLMETGGGVDSLGYERPSLIRTTASPSNSSTSQTNHNSSTLLENSSGSFLDHMYTLQNNGKSVGTSMLHR